MKQVIRKHSPLPAPAPLPLRLGVAEAKSRLSAVLRDATGGPTIIHSRGRDLAAVLSIAEYERLTREQGAGGRGGAKFLARVEALKQRHEGGVDEFAPRPLVFKPRKPFGRTTGVLR